MGKYILQNTNKSIIGKPHLNEYNKNQFFNALNVLEIPFYSWRIFTEEGNIQIGF